MWEKRYEPKSGTVHVGEFLGRNGFQLKLQLKISKSWGVVLELLAKQHCQFSPFGPIFEVNGLDWQCCLAGSSKMPPGF